MSIPVMVRFQIDHMKQEMVAALASHDTEIGGEIEKAMDAAVASFDWDREVQDMCENILHQSVKEAISAAAYTICHSPEVQAAMNARISKTLQVMFPDPTGTERVMKNPLDGHWWLCRGNQWVGEMSYREFRDAQIRGEIPDSEKP